MIVGFRFVPRKPEARRFRLVLRAKIDLHILYQP